MSFFDAVKRHIGIAREALADEKAGAAKAHADDGRVKTGHELAFMPAVLEVADTPPSPLGRTLVFVVCGFFVLALAWSIVGKMNIIAVAHGRIISTERVKVIQPLEAGVIRAILVEDGEIVKKGQVLIEFNSTDSSADRDRLQQEWMEREVEIARLMALMQPEPEGAFLPPDGASAALAERARSHMGAEIRRYNANMGALQSDIHRRRAELSTIAAGVRRLERKLKKVRERYESSAALFEKGVMARMTFNEREEALSDAEGMLEVEQRRLAEARAVLASAKADHTGAEAEFQSGVHERLAEARRDADAIEQEIIKAEKRSRLQVLTAPVDGMVQQLAVHTVGGVVTPAQPLMQIAPAGSTLEAEALVLNKDIGFVNEAQEAVVKVESFPFTKYGVIDGTVRRVYKDAVEQEDLGLTYPARVEMARAYIDVDGKRVDLTPGMTVTVEIKTGKRRVIDYIMAPLKRYQDESLREQ